MIGINRKIPERNPSQTRYAAFCVVLMYETYGLPALPNDKTLGRVRSSKHNTVFIRKRYGNAPFLPTDYTAHYSASSLIIRKQ